MKAQRTRIGRDIVTEFMPPRRKSSRVMILLGGLPSEPTKGKVMRFWSERGYWAFYPRYRGTWESGGAFLAQPPEKDVRDLIDALPKGFASIWGGDKVKFSPSEIVLLGSSFGGEVALMASRDERVRKAVALSPVVDWTKETKQEPHAWLKRVIKDGYGGAYRFSVRDWHRLIRGQLGNPVDEIDSFDGEKLLLLHAKDDSSVGCRPVEAFARKTRASATVYKTGGHFGLSDSMSPRLSRKIEKFLDL